MLALLVGGVALANLASAGPNVVIANVATHYVNLPGEQGKQAKVLTETVTIPGKGKVVRVRKIVTKAGTTTRLPGQTVAVKGPRHTVTVAGPTKTVTETVTQTETVEVTTTVDGGPPGPP
jgi:carbohydrate-binding DOMON domain-containing protein